MSAQADKLDDLALRLRTKAGEFAAADQTPVTAVLPPGPWLDWDQFPWWLELGISMFPGGDLIDIVRQLEQLIKLGDVDELVLVLAILGISDAGYLEPTPRERVSISLLS
jgi:hypothetical protein